MASLTMEEFEQCLTILGDGGSPGRLRDRLARLGAFHSRRGLNSYRAVSDRIYTLSGGLRRDVPAGRAFQALWAEHVGKRLNETVGRRLDELADEINQLLESDGSAKADRRDDLEAKVAEYEELLARRIGGAAARFDTLQKAVPLVAEILRARPLLDVPLDPPDPEGDDHAHHDHSHHDHAHHDHSHHDHAEHDHAEHQKDEASPSEDPKGG
jgi:hypothetical protein